MLEAAAMGKLNLKRVVVAGLAAGVVFFPTDAVADELVVGNEIRAGLQAIGKPEPQESAAMFAYSGKPVNVGVLVTSLSAAGAGATLSAEASPRNAPRDLPTCAGLSSCAGHPATRRPCL